MNKYGYDIHIKKYIKLNKVGYRNREGLSSEWFAILEIPGVYFVYNSQLSETVKYLLLIGSLAAIILFILLFNFVYNRMISRKFLRVFSSENKDPKNLVNILDNYISKHKKRTAKLHTEKVLELEKAKSCVNELGDHML